MKFCIFKGVPHSTSARAPGTALCLHQVTGYELSVTLFEARSRIFLPIAKSIPVAVQKDRGLWGRDCRLAILASSLRWLVGKNAFLPMDFVLLK